MVFISKIDILVFTVLCTFCIMVCTGAPSNSTTTHTKSATQPHARVERESNKTTSGPTTAKTPHGRTAGSSGNKTSSIPSHSTKTVSRQTRNAPAGNVSSYTNVRQTGATKQNLTSSLHSQQVRSVNGTSVSEPSPVVRPVPVRRVPAHPQPSKKSSSEEDAGTFVVSSHVPVRTLSSHSKSGNNSSATGAKGAPNTAFVHHEDADH